MRITGPLHSAQPGNTQYIALTKSDVLPSGEDLSGAHRVCVSFGALKGLLTQDYLPQRYVAHPTAISILAVFSG
jgi:hypothetical protein